VSEEEKKAYILGLRVALHECGFVIDQGWKLPDLFQYLNDKISLAKNGHVEIPTTLGKYEE